MSSALVKLGAPVAIAIALAAHFATTAAAGQVVTLTDVTGAAGDCTTPVVNAACATLFTGDDQMWPGGPAESATVTLTYRGPNESGSLGLYVTHFSSRSPQSGPYCTAPDPADKLDVRLTQQGATLYEGTLSTLARDHGQPADLLELPARPGAAPGRWASGTTASFTISVGLDTSADNPYMTCVSTADFAWMAE